MHVFHSDNGLKIVPIVMKTASKRIRESDFFSNEYVSILARMLLQLPVHPEMTEKPMNLPVRDAVGPSKGNVKPIVDKFNKGISTGQFGLPLEQKEKGGMISRGNVLSMVSKFQIQRALNAILPMSYDALVLLKSYLDPDVKDYRVLDMKSPTAVMEIKEHIDEIESNRVATISDI